MKIEVIWAQNSKSGISRATSTYGDEAVLLSNRKIGERYRLMIGVPEASSPAPAVAPAAASINRVKPTPVRESVDYQAISQMIKNEIRSLHQELAVNTERQSGQHDYGQSSAALLEAAGMPGSLQKLLSAELDAGLPAHQYLSSAKQKLLQSLPESTDLDRSVKTHVLCGNYGSGKTTVAVKIALKFKSLCEVPPILVSYKQTSAVTSALMKELSESFQLPIFEVQDIQTLKMIEDQLVGDSMLIVDTATTHMVQEIAEIDSMLNSVNFHLVNASDSFAAAQETLIGAAKWSSIIISRLEMQAARWPVIESLVKTQVPLSLGSVSPDLNSDLVRVAKKELLNQLDPEFRRALATAVPEVSDQAAA